MINFSLKGKVALVTGAAYGIGMAIAEAYAEAGAKIAFNCRSQHHLDQAMADYKAKGIEALGYICDVTKEDDVKKMVADIEQKLGTIDILVNNAGIIKRIPMTEMSTEEFRQVIDIDLTAPFIVSKAVIPGMIKKGHGKISTTFSATVSVRAILPHHRQHLCVSVRPTAAVILLISSSCLRHLPAVGVQLRTCKVQLCSWHPMPLILSTDIFSMSTAVSSPTSANSLSNSEPWMSLAISSA